MKRISIAILTMLLAAAFPAAADDKKANDLMQAALARETVQGDLKGAIDLYGKAVKEAGANRALAAKALLKSAECYEKLGDAEARKVYDRLLRDYADQAESATAARGRLDRLGSGTGTRSTGVTARHIPGADGLNAYNVSGDGRFLSYFDEGIWVLDLVNGQKRRLTPAAEKVFDPVFSPDSSQLAYTWATRDKAEIRLINLDGSGERVLYGAQGYLALGNWTAGHIVVTRTTGDRRELWTISTQDGSAQKIKDVDRKNWRPFLSPDGRWIAISRLTDGQELDIFLMSTADGTETALVRQAGDDRLAGWTPDGKGIVFTSDVEGHGYNSLYGLRVDNGRPAGAPVLIRHDIGNVTRSDSLCLTNQGSFYYVMRSGGSNVMTGELDTKTGRIAGAPALATSFLMGTNDGSDWSPDGTKMVYRTRWGMQAGKLSGESANLAILDVASGKIREITPRLEAFTDPRWSPDAKTILLKGSSAGRDGLFLCDAQSGETKILAEGLLTKPLWTSDGKSVLYFQLDSKSPYGGALVLHNLEPGRTKELYRSKDLWSRTMALSPDGTRIAFISNNTLMTAPIAGGDARTVLQLPKPETFEFFGGLAWMHDGRNLVFIKRPTGTTSRGVPSTLWRVPADGGPVEEMGLSMWAMHYLSAHPSGQRLAFSVGFPNRTELWVVEGFAGFK